MTSASFGAGLGSSAGSYRIILDVSENVNEGANYSTINWNLYIIKDSSTGYSYNLNSNGMSFVVEIDGNVVANGSGRYDFRSPNNYAGATYGLSSGTTWWASYHDWNNGTRAVSVRAYTSGPGPLTSADTGYQSFGLSDFDLRVNTPNQPSLSRSADGGAITMSTATSTRNSGPNADYFHWYYSTNNANWNFLAQTNPTSTNATSFTWNQTANGNGGTKPDPNTTYYFIAYAHNPDNQNSGWTTNSASNGISGVPGPPTSLTATRSTTDSGKVGLSWVAPSNTQGGITGYDVFVNDTYAESTTATSLTSIKANSGGTALTPGTTYTYKVAAKNAINSSGNTVSTLASSLTSGVSAVAPGAPAAPAGTLAISKIGRNVTIDAQASSNDFGNTINTANAAQGYFVQYQSALTQNGTYGYNGVDGAWSPAVKMSNQTDFVHTYDLLPAALWYKFRAYAANTVVNDKNGAKTYYPNNSGTLANFNTTASGLFVSAGGRRYRQTSESNPNTYQPTETAKRYGVEGAPPLSQTVKYWDLTNAKRFNGTTWTDLT